MESKLIKIIFLASFVWTAGMILTQGALRADTIVYGVTYGAGNFGTLNLNTGVFTQMSAPGLNDYELGVYGGVLYGDSRQCGCLFQLNPATGAVTFAPTLFNQNGNGFGAANGFGSTTAGLFVVGAASGGFNFLYAVNPATGTPTPIGLTGVNGGGGTGFLSSSNDSTKLYWEVQNGCNDTLYRLNTSTGAATMIGTALACYPSLTGNPYAMVFVGGTLWANFYSSGFGTINTSNGAQALVSRATPTFGGLAPFPLTPATPVFIGSMAQVVAEENWTTTFTLVNKGGAAAQAQLNFFGDATDPGRNGPLPLPLVFPQQGTANMLTAPSYSQKVEANASLIVATAGPQTPDTDVLQGSAQLASTGAVDGFAIFHHVLTTQEAVVPLETRNAPSYLLAFDNTGGIVTSVAVDNVSAQNAVIPIVVRDETGTVISAVGSKISLGGNGHISSAVSDLAPGSLNVRGTIEFDTPAGGQISVLGVRFTPPNSALTTVPPLANVGTAGGSFAYLASGGDGWETTFVLVNAGTTSAQATLSFFTNPTGAPLSLPLAYRGTTTTASSITPTLAAGATLVVQSSGASQFVTGSAHLSTTGNVSGFEIFRHNNQEGVVPLESRNATGYILAFDNTELTHTGVAVNAVSTQSVMIPVTVRDDTGAQIATDMLAVAANGVSAFTLGSDKYQGAATIRGTIEFDTPVGAQIGAVGIRMPAGDAHTYTTLPSLTK